LGFARWACDFLFAGLSAANKNKCSLRPLRLGGEKILLKYVTVFMNKSTK
jgi:hypothetical protein